MAPLIQFWVTSAFPQHITHRKSYRAVHVCPHGQMFRHSERWRLVFPFCLVSKAVFSDWVMGSQCQGNWLQNCSHWLHEPLNAQPRNSRLQGSLWRLREECYESSGWALPSLCMALFFSVHILFLGCLTKRYCTERLISSSRPWLGKMWTFRSMKQNFTIDPYIES